MIVKHNDGTYGHVSFGECDDSVRDSKDKVLELCERMDEAEMLLMAAFDTISKQERKLKKLKSKLK